MSFINSRSSKQYVDVSVVSCLDVFISTNTAKLEEGFTKRELSGLRDELSSVIEDIDYLLDED